MGIDEDISRASSVLRIVRAANFFAGAFYFSLFLAAFVMASIVESDLFGGLFWPVAVFQGSATLDNLPAILRYVALLIGFGLLATWVTLLMHYGINAVRPAFAVPALIILWFFFLLTIRGMESGGDSLRHLTVEAFLDLIRRYGWQGVLFLGPITLLVGWLSIRRWITPHDLREIARPLDPTSSALELYRGMFNAWPGVRQSIVHSAASFLLKFLAGIMIAVGLGAFSIFALNLNGWDSSDVNSLLQLLPFVAPLFVLPVLLRMGARALSRQSYEDKIRLDTRPPILFLRSFADDQVRLPRSLVSAVLTLGIGRRRLDHLLVERFGRHGPLLALGRPGEKTLPFGASRLYVQHGDWQETVLRLADQAAHIILVADASPGVRWEIETLLGQRFRHKLLMLCAPRERDLLSNPVIAAGFTDLPRGKRGVVGAFQSGSTTTGLRSANSRTPETYLVALQAFFRRGMTDA